ncbi:MAG: OmpA family protein [Sulfurovaceae bacterium]|nr:OmpA family protein [Sulfurovaceae bacterium]
MRSKWIERILGFFVLLAIIATNSIAGNLLHGPALGQINVSPNEGAIIVYRENDGDFKHVPAIFINEDKVMASLLPGDFGQSKVCTSSIQLRVASRGDLVTAGQSKTINVQKGKITYVKILETPDKTFIPIVVSEAEAQNALGNIKTTSNIINRYISQIVFDTDSLFAFNSAKLLPSARTTLDNLINDINARSGQVKHIKIIGHTDRIGKEAYNEKLSLKRAEAVANYLLKHGVSSIDTEGHGSREPVTTNCTGKFSPKLIQCLQPDRRVVVKLFRDGIE